MERVTKREIEGAVEQFVNTFFADQKWLGNADLKTWEDAVYSEIVMSKTYHIGTASISIRSNENRFEGGENIRKRIKPILRARLKELKAKGYNLKAI